jgi:hypothetical protein
MDLKQPRFQSSADTRFFIQRLSKMKVDETLTYDTLSAEFGKPVNGSNQNLYSARQSLLRDENMVFDIIPTIGLVRLNDIAIVDTSSRTARRIRSAARRGVNTLTAIADFSGLPREKQMRHSASVAILAVVSEMTATKGVTKVEKLTMSGKRSLPIAETIEAFK